MKLILLSGASCIHTTRWANGLASAGIEVHLVTLHQVKHQLDSRVFIYELPFGPPWGYFIAFAALKKLVKRIKPDLINTHYASGYGLLARLAGCRPNLLSVWGSDVYDFPKKSPLHRWLIRSNLKASTAVASTSHCMAREIAKTFQHEHVFITPFGVDDKQFRPGRKPAELESKVVIGTVKTLKSKYGIDTLIESFSIAWRQAGKPNNLILEITGDGPDRDKLENLALELGIGDNVVFHGAVSHEKVPEMLNRLDIYAALSRFDSESFGVAILEASACGLPVVVSDADGPAEVVNNNVTGYVVPRESPEAAAEVILNLVTDPIKRKQMGQKGIEHVRAHYTWARSVEIMCEAYEETIKLASANDGA